MRRTLHALAILCGLICSSGVVLAADNFDAGPILAQSKARYATLKSYDDTGSVVTVSRSPGAPANVERISFATAYVMPRQFLFESRKASNGERVAVWANNGDFNSWWSATKQHQDYPKGQGEMAFANNSYPTSGAVIQIASLIFASAQLQSPLAQFSEPKAAGVENLNNHPCFKI